MANESPKDSDITADLLMALLAVNSWTLERVGRLYGHLRVQGLFDAAAVGRMDIEEIQERLESAGYRRGPVLGTMMALRVQNVAVALAEDGAERLEKLEATGDTDSARKYLLGLNGVGPTVVENYLLLRSSTGT